MDAKYNVGEPVAIYAWVASVNTSAEGQVTYDLEVRDVQGDIIYIDDVTEEDLTTVF